MRQRKSPLCWDRRNIIGIVDSPSAAVAATKLPIGVVDALELRLDCLDPARVPEWVSEFDLPILITARDPREGGVGNWSATDRVGRLLDALEFASAMDLELANAGEFDAVIREARAREVQIVLSHHDFSGTVSLECARELVCAAHDFGADLFKIAVTPGTATDLCALIALQESAQMPLATMGMGRFGKISRLVCAAAGSALNYGWLAAPNVPGQWSASELQARFSELGIREIE